MKDPKDKVTYDIFQQDTLKWLEENVETIARQHDGYFRLSYIVGGYFKFVDGKTIEDCIRMARS